MKVEEILEEMENILLESGRVPFTNKRLVEEDDLARLIDDLRDAMPTQLVEAGRIISERQRVLEEAQQKADEIIQQAKAYHSKLTDENLITRQAQEQANEIVGHARRESEQTVREAEQKANEVMEQARKNSAQLTADAMSYAEEVFGLVSGQMEQILLTVKKDHEGMRQQFKR
jgi:cell division septum initiation protein DivIVA